MDKIYRILAVDDDRSTLTVLKFALANAPEFKCEVHTVDNAETGLKALAANVYDLVLSDYLMPGMNGIEFLKIVRQRYPHVKRMILTAYAEADVIIGAMDEAGVDVMVEKPWGKGKLTAAVAKALGI